MKKVVLLMVGVYRKIRSAIATFILKRSVKSYGRYVGAARIPHISSTATVEVGDHSSFNGLTISGFGGGKNW